MSEYGEGLSLDNLYSIYNSLKHLSKNTLQEIKSKGYFYEGDEDKDGISRGATDTSNDNTINGVFSSYALDESTYSHIETDGVICYNPKIVGKYVTTDNSVSTRYYNAKLFIFLCNELKCSYKNVNDVYKVFDEFCPCLIGVYSWSNPKWLPKGSEEFLKQAIGSNFEYTAHLYMKKGSPTVDFLFKDTDFNPNSCVNTDSLTQWVINSFGNNIKDVYIVFNKGNLRGNEVIARKNPDGELTLTIY